MNERRTFDLKVDRAETHLGELARLIDEYVDSHPYEIRRASDASGNKYTFYFHFTSQPSDDVAMALGDFVHNMRSALDHLACALVPPERREKMSFPIFFQGVWDASPSGETSRRREQRKRWRWCTERIDPHAVELLRRVQPPDNEGTVEEMDYGLRVIQYLDNMDKHRAMPIVAAGLHNATGEMLTGEGEWLPARGTLGPNESVATGPLTVPPGVLEVRLIGTPKVVVDTGRGDGKLLIPGPFPTFVEEVRGLLNRFRAYLNPRD